MKKHLVITGHYGSGKTNIAVELSSRLAQMGKKVLLLDLDIVNPYFRAFDARETLTAQGVTVLASQFANTNLDLPSTPAGAGAAFDGVYDHVVFDVGGDDDGAVVLGVYKEKLAAQGYDLFYVVNCFRPETAKPDAALTLLDRIEQISGLGCTGIINNSNLGRQTTARLVYGSADYAAQLSELSCLPIRFTSADRRLGLAGDYLNMHISTKQYF